jgi:glutathione S-transferase
VWNPSVARLQALPARQERIMSHQRILFQFPVSHYCEKTRWHLSHKGLDFREKNLLPGPHRFFTRRRAGLDTLPVLRDHHEYTGDSSRIALYLEKHYPEHPLIPEVGRGRRHVLEIEDQFDRMGMHVRRWFWGHLVERPAAMEAMLTPFRSPRFIKRMLIPMLRERVRSLYKLEPHAVAKSEERVLHGLDRLERLSQQEPHQYLVGDTLSLADVTAASLLGPVIMPPESPWAGIPETGLPRPMRRFREQALERAGGHWVLQRYEQDRHAPLADLQAA